MDEKKPIKILHQDVEDVNYLVVIEIHNDKEIYDAVYRADLPDDFQETKRVFRLYNFVHN